MKHWKIQEERTPGKERKKQQAERKQKGWIYHRKAFHVCNAYKPHTSSSEKEEKKKRPQHLLFKNLLLPIALLPREQLKFTFNWFLTDPEISHQENSAKNHIFSNKWKLRPMGNDQNKNTSPKMYKSLRRKQKRVEENKKDKREYYKNGNRTENGHC